MFPPLRSAFACYGGESHRVMPSNCWTRGRARNPATRVVGDLLPFPVTLSFPRLMAKARRHILALLASRGALCPHPL